MDEFPRRMHWKQIELTEEMKNKSRHEYRVLTEEEQALVNEFKDMGDAFIERCNSLGKKNRELSLAQTKMEEAVMWAVKHVTS